MTFWDRVLFLLDQKEISRKELIISTGIESSLISKGLSGGSIPRTETALKIARFLGTTVEYLVSGYSVHPLPPTVSIQDFEPYIDIITSISKLSEGNRRLIFQIITDLADDREESSS